jgi:hypothetical protein
MTTIFSSVCTSRVLTHNFANFFFIAVIMFAANKWISAQSASNQSVPLIDSTPFDAGSAKMFAPLPDHSDSIKKALLEFVIQWVFLFLGVSLFTMTSKSCSESSGQASGDSESSSQASGESATESEVAANNSDESQEKFNSVISQWKLSVQEKNEQVEALQKQALTQQTQLQAQKQQLEALQKSGQEKDNTIEEMHTLVQKMQYETDVEAAKLRKSESNFHKLFNQFSELTTAKNMACTCGLGVRGQ